MVGECNEIFTLLESWYRSERGGYLLDRLQGALNRHLDTAFGYHILQVGPVQCGPLFGECRIPHRILACDRPGAGTGLLCAGDELPLESDSVDVIIAHHVLEFASHPHQVLRELHRVLVPQGQLLITGWNPHSPYGIGIRARALLSRRSPWRAHHPVSRHRLHDWLSLLGCEVENTDYLYTLPPVGSGRLRRWLAAADGWCGDHGLPLGGLYLVRALKQVHAVHRPQLLRRRGEKLIGLAVPQAVPTPAAAPSLPAARGASTGKGGAESP